jgi:hypothetical protein
MCDSASEILETKRMLQIRKEVFRTHIFIRFFVVLVRILPAFVCNRQLSHPIRRQAHLRNNIIIILVMHIYLSVRWRMACGETIR